MKDKLLYYLLVKPISLLPFWILHGFSNILSFVLYYIVKYRRKVAYTNIKNSFPEKTEKEIKQIERKSYNFLADTIIESLKMFSISQDGVKKRMTTRNPEVLEKYFNQGKDVILMSGHIGNWEMWACAGSFQMEHKVKGVFKPIKSQFWDKTVKKSRGKFGIDLIPMKEALECLGNPNEPGAVALMIDQSPARSQKCFWTMFLHQETPVFYGAELMSKKYNAPAVYGHIQQVKRGFYEVTWSVISESPNDEEYGVILEKGTRILESKIRKQPHIWLWTHKRWKRERTAEETLIHKFPS